MSAAMAVQITIYLNEADEWQHRPLHLQILNYLRKENVAGATVFHAVAGFTGRSRIKTTSLVEAGYAAGWGRWPVGYNPLASGACRVPRLVGELLDRCSSSTWRVLDEAGLSVRQLTDTNPIFIAALLNTTLRRLFGPEFPLLDIPAAPESRAG